MLVCLDKQNPATVRGTFFRSANVRSLSDIHVLRDTRASMHVARPLNSLCSTLASSGSLDSGAVGTRERHPMHQAAPFNHIVDPFVHGAAVVPDGE